MSLMSSPFEFRADRFTQKYAAYNDPIIQQANSYSELKNIVKDYRTCVITYAQAQTAMRNNDHSNASWSPNDYTDTLVNEQSILNPNKRNKPCKVSSWSSWSECDSGEQIRSRTIVQERIVNCMASPCPEELVERRSCDSLPPSSGENGGDTGENGGDIGENAGDTGTNGDEDLTPEQKAAIENSGSANTSTDSSLTDKMKEHWVLIGLGVAGLVFLG